MVRKCENTRTESHGAHQRAGLEAVLTIGICHLHKKRDISKLIPVITTKRLQCSTDSLCNCVLIPTYTPCQIASKSDELGLGTYSKMCSTGGSCLIFALYSAACASYSAFSASDSCSYAAFLISRESFKFPSVGVRLCSDSSDFKVIESWLWFAFAESFWALVTWGSLAGLISLTASCGLALKKWRAIFFEQDYCRLAWHVKLTNRHTVSRDESSRHLVHQSWTLRHRADTHLKEPILFWRLSFYCQRQSSRVGVDSKKLSESL